MPDSRLITRCQRPRDLKVDDAPPHIDIGYLLRGLLLYDEVVVDSLYLNEVVVLCAAFGYDAVLELVRSGAVRFLITRPLLARWKPLDAQAAQALPLHFWFISTAPSHETHVSKYNDLLNQALLGLLNKKKANRLTGEVIDAVTGPATLDAIGSPDKFWRSVDTDDPIFRVALDSVVRRAHGVDSRTMPYDIRVRRVGDNECAVETTVHDVLNVPVAEGERLVKHALLIAGGIDFQVGVLAQFDAVSAFDPSEAVVFRAMVGELAMRHTQESQDTRFKHVLDLIGFPDLIEKRDIGNYIDLKGLVKLRSSDDAIHFRRWVNQPSSLTPEEVAQFFADFNSKTRKIMTGPTVQVARMMVTGIVSKLYPVLGPAPDAFDNLVLDRFIRPPDAVLGFVNRLDAALHRAIPAASDDDLASESTIARVNFPRIT